MEELTEREKLAKRMLRRAEFLRSFLFWMAFPAGVALSYLYQPQLFRFQIDFGRYMIAAWIYMYLALMNIFTGKFSAQANQDMSIGIDYLAAGTTALITVAVLVIVFWAIGRVLVSNAKTTLQLSFPKEKATEITERVEQGLVYMNKDSDTFAGALKRKVKQFLLSLGIFVGAVVFVFLAYFIYFKFIK